MNLAEKTADLRRAYRYGQQTGNPGAFLSAIPPFVSALAISFDSSEKAVRRIADMRRVEVVLTDIHSQRGPVVGGTWSSRVPLINGMGDVPGFLSGLADAADNLREAILTLGGNVAEPRLGRFARICQESLDRSEALAWLPEFADGLDTLSEAAEKLSAPSKMEMKLVPVGAITETTRPEGPRGPRRPSR